MKNKRIAGKKNRWKKKQNRLVPRVVAQLISANELALHYTALLAYDMARLMQKM